MEAARWHWLLWLQAIPVALFWSIILVRCGSKTDPSPLSEELSRILFVAVYVFYLNCTSHVTAIITVLFKHFIVGKNEWINEFITKCRKLFCWITRLQRDVVDLIWHLCSFYTFSVVSVWDLNMVKGGKLSSEYCCCRVLYSMCSWKYY